ncbi:acyl-CoA-binding protein [Salinisphaera sp. SPP-AMP-43]|uniref:acyl-CoA-binding protein n=1 Tax=Salinisphaera sp. SPP-AMP-43 TaxID=3121288 RepID=UPI003C6E89F2
MSDLQAQFEQAQKDVETLSKRPSNEELLALYAHYKQANEGDVSGKRPGMTDFRGRAKYDAWTKLKGMEAEQAMSGYISKVNALLDGEKI